MISAVTAAWAIAALTGSQPVAGQPAAAAASLHAITASASYAAAGLAALADLPQQIATDPYRDTPGSDLLTSLQGKDVVFAFIESYGRVAVQGSSFSGGVDQVLRDGEAQLRADGYASQSAFLTSPTFGGLSWLAHSTFQTGLWVDRQPLYSEVIRSDRFTLSEAFGRAGWRTVSVVPSNSEPWSFGRSFYRFDTLLDANNVGYRGPSFGYARIPDQYTWKHFADQPARHRSPAGHGGDRPRLLAYAVGAAPGARALVPSRRRFRVRAPARHRGSRRPPSGRTRSGCGRHTPSPIRYSLGAMFAFLHESDDPNLVLVVLGDHQPATIVSGQDAGHDVPISIISKDTTVFESIKGWQWHDGMRPAPDAPVWPMSAFRDRFLDAFSAG